MSAPSGSAAERWVHWVHWLLLGCALAAALALGSRGLRQARVTRVATDPASAVPPGPGLLVTADVAALVRAARVELARAGADQLLGLAETCGFEPLLALKRVAFALPFQARPSREAPDFALIAETELSEQALATCAEAVIKKRGGTPVRSRIGQFLSVRDRERPLGELAARADGLLVFSGGQYFRDVVDAAAGVKTPDPAAQLRDEVHAELRRTLAPGQLFASFIAGAAPQLPGVRVVGASLRLERDALLRGFVGCESSAACADAAELLEQLRERLASDPELRALGQLTVAQREAQLELSVRLPPSELARIVTHALPSE